MGAGVALHGLILLRRQRFGRRLLGSVLHSFFRRAAGVALDRRAPRADDAARDEAPERLDERHVVGEVVGRRADPGVEGEVGPQGRAKGAPPPEPKRRKKE